MSSLDLRIEDILETAVYELDTIISQEHADQLVELLRTKEKRKLNQDEIRTRLVHWYKDRNLRDRRLHFRKIDFDYTIECAVELQVSKLQEKRKFRLVELPYHHQSIPTETQEDLWERALATAFRETENTWIRRGSQGIQDCHKCRCSGEVRCSKCRGSGEDEDRCLRCHGSGKIGRAGKASTEQSRSCPRCKGRGKTTSQCNKCRGRGEVTCPKCDGERRLYTYEEIVAETDLQSKQQLVSNLEHLKAKWLPDTALHSLEKNMYSTPEITPDTSTVELGKQYQLRFFDIHRITFWYQEEREILLINKEVYPIDGSYLRDWRSIIYLVIGIVVLAVSLYFLIYYFKG